MLRGATFVDLRDLDPATGFDGLARAFQDLAEDVKRSIERTLHHATDSPGAYFYSKIAGYSAYHDGTGPTNARIYAPHLIGVVVDGRYALHIDLSEPDATFLSVMTLPFAAPVCKSAGATYSPDFELSARGTGPFKLSGWDQARQIRFTRHEGYYRPTLPHLDGIEWSLLMPQRVRDVWLDAAERQTRASRRLRRAILGAVF